MFSIRVNSPIKVSFCGSYKTPEGKENSYIIARECDNQDSFEKPSGNKFPVKLFIDGELPAGIIGGGYFTVNEIVGFDVRHVLATDKRGNKLTDRYGNEYYNNEIVLIVNEVQGYPPQEESKEGTKKKPSKAQ